MTSRMTPGPARILVIEDDAPIAAVLRRGLELAGHVVEIAEDGAAGAARWRLGDIDLIILDVMLPGIGGVELCAAMRAERDATPVLLLTAHDDPELRAAGLAAGASAHIVKPFVYADLLATLDRLIAAGR